MERNAYLIQKKIRQYILPGVLMTVAMQLGNVVDGMIVGNLLGSEAMAAIELSMPVLLTLQMPALMLAMGGAAEAAVLLGKRSLPEAGGVFSASLAAGAAVSLLFALLAPFLPGTLALALAGNEQMAAVAGIPSAAFTLMSALASVIINSAIVRYLGNEPMAIYSVCANAVLIAELCVGGVIGLIPSIGGILYGERDYYGIRALCKKVLTYSYLTIAALLFVFLLFPQWIAGLFGIRDGELLVMCKLALRIFACGFPFYVYNKFLMSYYQTILQPGLSTVITVLQGFGVVVPLTLVGIFWMGLPGVCVAAVVSEVLTILVSVLYRMGGQRAGRFPGGGRYMLPDIAEETCLDFSIENHLEDVIKLRDALFDFCKENGIGEKDAKMIGLALEEICANVIRYGYRGNDRSFIDISFTIQDGSYLLRVRDDGVPFNPLE